MSIVYANNDALGKQNRIENFCKPMATNKQYPAEGIYNTLSAKTNPTLKKMLLAGKNGQINIVIPIITYLQKFMFFIHTYIFSSFEKFSNYLKVLFLREINVYIINVPNMNQKIMTTKVL